MEENAGVLLEFRVGQKVVCTEGFTGSPRAHLHSSMPQKIVAAWVKPYCVKMHRPEPRM
jgi:hypothetical protein